MRFQVSIIIFATSPSVSALYFFLFVVFKLNYYYPSRLGTIGFVTIGNKWVHCAESFLLISPNLPLTMPAQCYFFQPRAKADNQLENATGSQSRLKSSVKKVKRVGYQNVRLHQAPNRANVGVALAAPNLAKLKMYKTNCIHK